MMLKAVLLLSIAPLSAGLTHAGIATKEQDVPQSDGKNHAANVPLSEARPLSSKTGIQAAKTNAEAASPQKPLEMPKIGVGTASSTVKQGQAKAEMNQTSVYSMYKDYSLSGGWNPQIDIYVINLDNRQDKCTCMANQLNHLPANVYRHGASGGPDCNVGNFFSGGRNWNGEAALFCSNRHVWERAAETKADFIVILEDDANLHEGWFQRVRELAQCKDWNFLNLDTFDDNAESRDGYREDLCGNAGFMNHQGYGTHMQIIRRKFLKEMLEIGEGNQGALDHWIKQLDSGRGGYRWMPDMVHQFHMDVGELGDKEGCGGGYNSDIQNFGRIWPVPEKKPDRMKC